METSRSFSRRHLAGLAGTATVAASTSLWPARAGAASGAPAMSPWIEESFFTDLPTDFVMGTSSGDFPVAPFPPGIPLLTEPRLRATVVFGGKVRDAGGQVVGFASEYEEIQPESDLPAGIKISRTVWTVVLPQRGTIAFEQIERTPDDVAAAFRQAAESGLWVGEIHARVTVGPGPRGEGVVIGGSGDFAGARGVGLELGTIRRIDAAAREVSGTFELRLRYRVQRRSRS